MTKRHIETLTAHHGLNLTHAHQGEQKMLVTYAHGIAKQRDGHRDTLPKGGQMHADATPLAGGGTQTTIAYPEHRTIVVVHDDPDNDQPDANHEQITLHVFEYATSDDFEQGLKTQIPSVEARAV